MRTEQPPGNRRPLYRWRLMARREVVAFLEAIVPYMRVKREQTMERLDELLALERVA